MAHYFDDMFQRSVNGHSRHPSGNSLVRRYSTARSIGARSDFENSTHGADDDDARSTAASVFSDDPERARARSEADDHMHQYISDQLTRYKADNTTGQYDEEDLETKA